MIKKKVDQFVELGRKSLNCTDQHNFSMVVAWVISTERSLLTLFPEVVFVDDVKDTNKECRPLLMISGKDTNGKVFTILLIFLPNKQSWIFR